MRLLGAKYGLSKNELRTILREKQSHNHSTIDTHARTHTHTVTQHKDFVTCIKWVPCSAYVYVPMACRWSKWHLSTWKCMTPSRYMRQKQVQIVKFQHDKWIIWGLTYLFNRNFIEGTPHLSCTFITHSHSLNQHSRDTQRLSKAPMSLETIPVTT